ncbi:MAG: tripartite tricarboxylate transporter substrate binding protein, partial [Rhodobacteraceae bacterium]|nr:tripartite tricarboxylate transporter substrate binding protein [Paracoccaceae bacterium]
PTVNEVGYSALEKIIGWSAIYGPPDLPDEVVSKWAEVLNSLKEDRAWLRMTRSLGNIVSIMSPEETKAFVGDQYMVFDNAVNELGLRIE